MILEYTGSTLAWFNYSNYATFLPHLWWYLLTQQYVQRCTCACCGTLSDFSLQYHLPIALAFGRVAVVKLSRYNQGHHLSVNGWLAWTTNSFHLLRVSPVLNTRKVPPRTSTLKPIFWRNRYKEYVLSRTKRDAVSDTTLRNNF